MTEQELIELWGDGQMTEQQLIELWGDGTQFGMNTEMVGALNNAFREVAVKFALVVADKAYGVGYDDGWEDGGKNGYNDGWLSGVDSVRSGSLGD
jgi:hypothetical protein